MYYELAIPPPKTVIGDLVVDIVVNKERTNYATSRTKYLIQLIDEQFEP